MWEKKNHDAMLRSYKLATKICYCRASKERATDSRCPQKSFLGIFSPSAYNNTSSLTIPFTTRCSDAN
jgi:hypothetical protein